MLLLITLHSVSGSPNAVDGFAGAGVLLLPNPTGRWISSFA